MAPNSVGELGGTGTRRRVADRESVFFDSKFAPAPRFSKYIIPPMSTSTRSLAALTLGCVFAAAIFGFGSAVFSFQMSADGDDARTQLILITRLAAYLALALMLVFKGGWRGVFAAITMTVAATTIEWLLFPTAYEFALAQSPAMMDEGVESIARPSYGLWAMEDIIGVGLCAALAQGLRMMAGVNPNATPDE
jgi:hypothetical protein